MRKGRHGVGRPSDAWLHYRDTCPPPTETNRLLTRWSLSFSLSLTIWVLSRDRDKKLVCVVEGKGRESKKGKKRMSGSNLETRSLMDELRSFDSGGFFDLGHPLLNRMAESFIRAAGVYYFSLSLNLIIFFLQIIVFFLIWYSHACLADWSDSSSDAGSLFYSSRKWVLKLFN